MKKMALCNYYVVSVHGAKAVKAGYDFQHGHCYRQIIDHKKVIGQLEVVLDDPELIYNNFSSEWVDISFIRAANVAKVLHQLERLGFSGCFAILQEFATPECDGCGKTICGLII